MRGCLKFFLFASAVSLYAVEAPPPSTPTAPASKSQASIDANAKFFYTIDPKQRSADFIQAYDLLRKEKPTFKISIRTSNSMVLANIVDLSAASAGTLLFVKIQSNTGPKTVVIPVEELTEMFYSP